MTLFSVASICYITIIQSKISKPGLWYGSGKALASQYCTDSRCSPPNRVPTVMNPTTRVTARTMSNEIELFDGTSTNWQKKRIIEFQTV